MVLKLYLSKSDMNDHEDDEQVKQRIALLEKLESSIWSLLVEAGGRSELRLWLCNSIAGINSISPRHQCELFVKILKSKREKRTLATQIFQLIFEKQPRTAGHVLSNKSHLLENFFKGNRRRILQWFSSFSGNGDSDHKKGAKALSQFAFVNRDICWEELEWKGKHGQSPAMVATKPHYFLDLDVEKTIENFIEYVPEFWSSDEFAESLKDGEILSIDREFFVDFFVKLINKDSKEAWKVVNEFLIEQPFSSLCRHLLIALDENDLQHFLESLSKLLKTRTEPVDFTNPSYWLEIILTKWSDTTSMDQIFLLNAVISEKRQLLRLINEEENREEKMKIGDLVSQVCTSSRPSNPFAKDEKPVKWLGLQAWALYYRLSEECQTPESWESLFNENGISFRNNRYSLLKSEDWESDLDEKGSSRFKHKKKDKHRKRRRRTFDADDILLDLEFSGSSQGVQVSTGSWMLSTDGYASSWTSLDLPEHLSSFCLSTWLKRVVAR
ncbi:uncharacterized protein LOC124942798 [Impatiens glandulifera]|uniref:uncharacterized protein LOC124942798 n=1 Tax=Impatiens glandulifera TaxID=253017 RepID=UPI001FB0B5D0|nr:uncharacterized protein LOC124942798 [Impatiens glandulifera]